MIEQIQAVLAEVTTRYDKRLQHCQVSAVLSDRNECMLSGVILDGVMRLALVSHLSSRFPAISFNTAGVRVLRSETPQWLIVNTNLTSLHTSYSFLSEMVSQLVCGMMVEVLQEEGRWVYVRQTDGYLGWVYRPFFAPVTAPSVPTHIVCKPTSLMRCDLDANANIVSLVMGGTAVSIPFSQGQWAKLQLTTDLDGWLRTADLRSLNTMPHTETDRRQQIMKDAHQFIGVPYLWGGGSALGIDCSGYAQLLHRLIGITLPRDADMQFAAGQPVEGNYQPGDLFFFGSEGGYRHITHVGISLGGWRMIHSSRGRNGVYVDDVQAVSHLRDSFAGARTFLI